MVVQETVWYRTLAEDFERRIQTGELKQGEALPSRIAIAARWGVSRWVVEKAFTILETKKLIYAVRGGRTYVGQPGGVEGPTPGMFSAAGR